MPKARVHVSVASSDSLARDLLYPEELVAPGDVHAEIERRQVEHGVYAWWFDHALPLVPRDDCQHMGSHDMLYVGIAPPTRSDGKRRRLSPIKRRLVRNHLQGSIRRSTLRQSLVALLNRHMAFSCWRDASGRSRMRAEDEARLTEWISTHAGVTFMHTDDPWSLEEALVRDGPSLPLNLSMSRHPFRKTLSALRAQVGRGADKYLEDTANHP